MSLDTLAVALVVLLALAFVVRRFLPGKTRSAKPKPGPDVPLSRLVRKRKDERR